MKTICLPRLLIIYLHLFFSLHGVLTKAQCLLTDGSMSANAKGNPQFFHWDTTGIVSDIPVSANKQTAALWMHCNTDSLQWLETSVYLDFNTSSANYLEVAFRCDSTLQNGWFLRLGDVEDGIKLIERRNGKERLECFAEKGYFNRSKSNLTLRWIKQRELMLILFKDSAWEQFKMLCAAIDTLSFGNNATGFLIVQTGSGAATKHRVRKYLVGPPRPDITPPSLKNIQWQSPTWANLTFSEPITLENKNQLVCNKQPADTFFLTSSKTLRAKFPPQTCNESHTISVQNAKDSAGNIQPLQQNSGWIYCKTPIFPYQVTITEIMSDPLPNLGYLPNVPYVELRNNTSEKLWLDELTLSDPATTCLLPKILLQPMQRVTLYDQSDTQTMRGIPNAIPCKLPYLNLESDLLTLKNSQGQIIHQFQYQPWMHEPEREDGGYSLEHNDTTQPCIDLFHWRSNAALGGTPSKPNNPTPPPNTPNRAQTNSYFPFEIARIQAHYPDTIMVEFTHPLHPYLPIPTLKDSSNQHSFIPVANANLRYLVRPPLQPNERLLIYVQQAKNCQNQPLNDSISDLCYTTDIPDKQSLQFNEVMFNAQDHLTDFVELVNTSAKPIQLLGLQLHVVQDDQSLDIIPLSSQPLVIFPDEIFCFSGNPYRLCTYSSPGLYKNHLYVPNFPNLPADKATLRLVHPMDQVVDEMKYDASMHTPILTSNKGVSLEKTHPIAPSTDIAHWVSATSTAGFSTPAEPNSQQSLKAKHKFKRYFQLEKTIYQFQSDDYIVVNHSLPKAGFMLNVSLFTFAGSRIPLSNNLIQVSQEGRLLIPLYALRQQLPSGNYILNIHAYHRDSDLCNQRLRLVLLQGT